MNASLIVLMCLWSLVERILALKLVEVPDAEDPQQALSKMPWAKQWPQRGDIVRPRMLAMSGCSGSTAIMLYARALLRYHGIPVPMSLSPEHVIWDGKPHAPAERGGLLAWPAELLKADMNWFYEEAGGNLGKAMEMLNDYSTARNQTLFFKGMFNQILADWDELEQPFERMNMTVVVGYRENLLDQLVCQVKDCFQDTYGYPVDTSTGKRSSLCFNRRGSTVVHAETVPTSLTQRRHADDMLSAGSGYKAEVNTTNLLSNIEAEIDRLRQVKQRLGSVVPTFHEISDADLLDFQSGTPESLDRGVLAWSNLLTSFGVTPDVHRIKWFLQLFTGSYSAPPSHSESIYNWREVKAVLHGTPYEHWFRG